MSFEPLDTRLIQDRIRDQVAAMQEVGGAADYAAIEALTSFFSPSAYVVLAQERDQTQSNELPGRRPSGKQHVQATIGVIMALRNYRDPAGETVSQDARQMIGLVRASLWGWTADQARFSRLFFQQGDVLDYNQNTLLWIDVYNTTYFIGGTA